MDHYRSADRGGSSFAVIAATDELWIVALVLATYIAHFVVWNVMAASARQKATPTDLMGRVGSVGRLVGIAVGAAADGGFMDGAATSHEG